MHTGRRLHLRLPENWPWADAFLIALSYITPSRCAADRDRTPTRPRAQDLGEAGPIGRSGTSNPDPKPIHTQPQPLSIFNSVGRCIRVKWGNGGSAHIRWLDWLRTAGSGCSVR